MRYGSLFSGIGGFDLGFDRAGMECAWQVEIDDRCREVEERHYPTNTRRFQDVRAVGKHNLTAVDVICGGFPCQDLSVAGKRAGLDGERSGLWYEFHRIIAELRPGWVVIENVPGLLSSNKGRDFAIILQGLVKLGYGVCWRVLDAQYFGLAQRRRRVFIVGHLGDGRAAEVLFEREGGCWDPPPSREAGEGTAWDVVPGLTASGRGVERAGESRGQDPVIPMAFNPQSGGDMRLGIGDKPTALQANQTTAVVFGGNNTSGQIDVATACNAKGGTGRSDFESETFVAYNIMPQNSARDYKAKETPVSQCLSTNGNHSGDQGGTYIANWQSGGGRMDDDKAASLRSGAEKSYQFLWEMSHADEVVRDNGEVAPTLQQRMGTGGNQVPMVGVRRLTPTECARLQGFPDDWNNWLSDSARYRQFGNAVAVPCAEWIARRIIEHGQNLASAAQD